MPPLIPPAEPSRPCPSDVSGRDRWPLTVSFPGAQHRDPLPIRPLLLSLIIAIPAFVACGGISQLSSTAPEAPDSASTSLRERAASDNNTGAELARRGDYENAAARFESACTAGSAEGCYNLGTLIEARRSGVTLDTTRAAALFNMALSVGDARFCDEVGTLFKKGVGVAKDEARAVALYNKACEKGSTDGCYNLGVMFQYGLGIAQDETRAEALFTKACKRGNNGACIALQMLRESGP
jgi:TPR repeat protein